MTMTMNQGPCFLLSERQFPASRLFFLNDEFLEQVRSVRHRLGVWTFDQIRIFVSEGQNAAGFAADDGISRLDKRMELTDVEFRVGPSGIRKTLGNHWTAAARALGEADVIPGGFEQLGRGDADFRIV